VSLKCGCGKSNVNDIFESSRCRQLGMGKLSAKSPLAEAELVAQTSEHHEGDDIGGILGSV
jgi:hypothetical protein